MEIKDIITIIFSSTLITAIITAIFNLLMNRKKETIENITKERKVWRDELRRIALSIQKSNDIDELLMAVSELKVRINAYGMVRNSIFEDSHIWQLINSLESLESISIEDLRKIKRKFVNQISCILKYDWERSKAEIKGNVQTRIVIISLIISFLLYSIKWFYNYKLGSDEILFYILYCFIYTLLVAFCMLIISFADKWKNKVQFCFFCISGVIGYIFFFVLMFLTVKTAKAFDPIDCILNIAPIIVLIYGVEMKIITYKKNVSRFILSILASSDKDKFDNKYLIFIKSKKIKNNISEIDFTLKNDTYLFFKISD